MGPHGMGWARSDQGESGANDNRSETKGRERSERCAERSEGWRERSERVERTCKGVRKERVCSWSTKKRVVPGAQEKDCVEDTREW